jgi:anthranilate synthase component 1
MVIPEGVVRLTVRGSHAVYRTLSSRGEPLLSSLASRLGDASLGNGCIRSTFPAEPPAGGLSDQDRLRSPSSLDALRLLAGLVEDDRPDQGPPPGVYGAFSYEMVDRWEELPPRRSDALDEPDLNFVLALDSIFFDHIKNEVSVITRSLSRSDEADTDSRHQRYIETLSEKISSPFLNEPDFNTEVDEKNVEPDETDEAFVASVEKFLTHIHAGDIFQGVLSRGLMMRSNATPLSVYSVLRKRNPSPYMFYIDLGDGVLFGASPETCLKVENGQVEIRPIAGTAPRGFQTDGDIDEELDARLAVGLLLDRKEQAEHVMLVDLARNDVARVSLPGTRRVIDPFCLEKYSHVQHLVSRVRGELLPDLDALHAYRASANMGTLSGAPKLRAMELIRETEPHSRGFYGGAVGYLLQDGAFDSCIVIRSLRFKEGVYITRVGAGIVADSSPRRELEETLHKARACRLAVALAERNAS